MQKENNNYLLAYDIVHTFRINPKAYESERSRKDVTYHVVERHGNYILCHYKTKNGIEISECFTRGNFEEWCRDGKLEVLS